MRRLTLLLLLLIVVRLGCRADEGMWIPMLLQKYNVEDMQKQGFKLTAQDIYDINQASLKDAVIGLGREGSPFHHFCTGELVSTEGLLVTNHHCSFDMIQSHSSLEKNYLRDGFWAQSKSDELANPGITASILVRMEDVTEQIMSQLTDSMSEKDRADKIKEVIKNAEQKAVEGTNLKANIKPYFNGNQYFMSVFKIYKDVRLVGAPASSIGKFGGDTDNWTWPRHTGDFSVLRIYANENNEPADYSEKNKPYKPATFFKISTKGVQEGDFTMVFGYPGTTTEYLTSFAIDQLANVENPAKIAIRTAKLNIINDAMESNELLRIKYASKAASVANSWKKWQGESKGLKRFNTVESKKKLEQQFEIWAKGNTKYDGLTERYAKLFGDRKDLKLAATYVNEAGKRGAEIIGFSTTIYNLLKKGASKEQLKIVVDEFYKDYNPYTDEKILAAMMKLYNEGLAPEWIPVEIATARKTGYDAFAANLFEKSIFSNPDKLNTFIDKSGTNSYLKLQKDPAYKLALSIDVFYTEKIYPHLTMIDKELNKLDRIWLAGLMEMNPDKVFYPDANSTLRIAYGKIGGYSPVDAVYYKHYTTLDGIMEKDNPEIYDYDIPQKLRDVYEAKDFGPYTQNGQIPVCFIASNHTTGGNSGSPVLNANGHLIGINFDRAWDGVMSDIQYDPQICRNISVDIRYLLFVIDKVAGARHLIDEMVLVTD